MKVIVCGGRNFDNRQMVVRFLTRLHAQEPISCVIHGAARGADALAEEWARSHEVTYIGVPARWKVDGKRAGPLRNQRMIDEHQPGCVVAFPGGNGTADMMARAEMHGLCVYRVTE
jgi:hypothetical protein